MIETLAFGFFECKYSVSCIEYPPYMDLAVKEWISTKNAYKMGVVIFMVNILMLIVGVPVAELLF